MAHHLGHDCRRSADRGERQIAAVEGLNIEFQGERMLDVYLRSRIVRLRELNSLSRPEG